LAQVLYFALSANLDCSSCTISLEHHGSSVEAQTLLGVEGFADGLRRLVTEKQQIREIPKGQRFVGRPSLEKLFSQKSRVKASRDRLIVKNFLALHYSTVSRIVAGADREQI
jgi:hypothetical protein